MKPDVIFGVIRSMGWEIVEEEFESCCDNVAVFPVLHKHRLKVNTTADIEDQIFGVCAYALCGLTDKKHNVWFKGDWAKDSKCCCIISGWDHAKIQGFISGVYESLAMVSRWMKV